MTLHPSKFCFFFSLRQGTICIAVVEITLTAFALLLMILGAERAQEIAAEAQVDMVDGPSIADIPKLDSFGDSDDQGLLNPVPVQTYFFRNVGPFTVRRGQQLATVLMFFMYTGVVGATTHLLICLLLLYGAIRGIPRLLLPWTTMVLLSISVIIVALLIFAFMPFPGCKGEVYAFFTIIIAFEAHSWIIIYSFYRELTATAACRIANNILPSYNVLGPIQFSRVDI